MDQIRFKSTRTWAKCILGHGRRRHYSSPIPSPHLAAQLAATLLPPPTSSSLHHLPFSFSATACLLYPPHKFPTPSSVSIPHSTPQAAAAGSRICCCWCFATPLSISAAVSYMADWLTLSFFFLPYSSFMRFLNFEYRAVRTREIGMFHARVSFFFFTFQAHAVEHLLLPLLVVIVRHFWLVRSCAKILHSRELYSIFLLKGLHLQCPFPFVQILAELYAKCLQVQQ